MEVAADTIRIVWTIISLLALTVSFALPFVAFEEKRDSNVELDVVKNREGERILAEQNLSVASKLFYIHIAFIFVNLPFATAGLIATLVPTGNSSPGRAVLISSFLIGAQLIIAAIQLLLLFITLGMRSGRREWARYMASIRRIKHEGDRLSDEVQANREIDRKNLETTERIEERMNQMDGDTPEE